MSSNQIVIIGAGLSGISAGVKLMENGFNDVLILEAENRIGGRINSVEFGGDGKKIDLGGQWVSGEFNNVIYEMTKKHFEFGSTSKKEIFYLSNGKLADQQQCNKLMDLAYGILEESYRDMMKYEGSLGEFFTSRYQRALDSDEYKDFDGQLADLIMENLHQKQNVHYASKNWFEISSKLKGEYDFVKGNQYFTWGKHGFEKVIDFITVRSFLKAKKNLMHLNLINF